MGPNKEDKKEVTDYSSEESLHLEDDDYYSDYYDDPRWEALIDDE